MLAAILSAGTVLAQMEAERQYEARFMAMVQTLPVEQQQAAVLAHRQVQEKARREALEERRHQELCRAIRSVRPSGIGIFW